MAKAPKEKAPKSAAAEAPEFKYGIQDVCSATDLQPASVRVYLRNSDLKKAGTRWGWNTKAELDAAIKVVKTAQSTPTTDSKPAKSKARKAKETA